MDFRSSFKDWIKATYVLFAFFSAFCFGALKGLIVGPFAGVILIIGNVGVILGLFPAHVAWTIHTLLKISMFDSATKIAVLLALPALFGLWLGVGVAASVLVGVGYGFFTPWISTFEAFRHHNHSNKFLHSLLDGTWGTIKGSCTVVRDFLDLCYYSYPSYLKELRDSPHSNQLPRLRLIEIPGCMIIGIMGVIVEVPIYTTIAIVKSPYLLLKGWFRLMHDLISREGPFLETPCIPIAGLVILLWPIFVLACIFFAIFSSFFVGLYASFVVYQERSFGRGVAYVIAMVAEFDEFTNDWLYLREGTIFPKPQYRKKMMVCVSFLTSRKNYSKYIFIYSMHDQNMCSPGHCLIRHDVAAIREEKSSHIWENMMRSCEIRGKELLDGNVLKAEDLYEWLKDKNSDEAKVIGVGLPCYSLLQTLVFSIKSNSSGLLLLDGIEITSLNRPKNKLLDWFFNPIMLLKEQIRVINLMEAEIRYLEKLVLFGNIKLLKSKGLVEELVANISYPKMQISSSPLKHVSVAYTACTSSQNMYQNYRKEGEKDKKDKGKLTSWSWGKKRKAEDEKEDRVQ
ncbi:putative membrane protein [Senna tora]|uniref:Putative membrane protein n=1 Tax=Senna tora TaxID=362788 RepID=A0A834SVE2_9FABA|nr:putative membrane protein [Senna tora]